MICQYNQRDKQTGIHNTTSVLYYNKPTSKKFYTFLEDRYNYLEELPGRGWLLTIGKVP